MRILVVSDTHGRWTRLYDAVRAVPDADEIIHLGDGAEDVEKCIESITGCRIICVAGNCDIRSHNPEIRLLTLSGKRVLCTHGHNYRVKMGPDRLVYAAMEQQADICLFGHTHTAACFYHEGIHFMNPGSLGAPRDGKPTFGVVDITDTGIMCNIREYRPK